MSSVEKVSSSPTSKQEFGEDMKSSRLTSKEIVDGLIPQEGPLPRTMIMDLELTLWELFKNGRKGRKEVLWEMNYFLLIDPLYRPRRYQSRSWSQVDGLLQVWSPWLLNSLRAQLFGKVQRQTAPRLFMSPPTRGALPLVVTMPSKHSRLLMEWFQSSLPETRSFCSSTGSPGDASHRVAAMDFTDAIANFSSRRPATGTGTTELKPDISAPGVEVPSSWNTGDGQYAYL
jgi:hypothetical protein